MRAEIISLNSVAQNFYDVKSGQKKFLEDIKEKVNMIEKGIDNISINDKILFKNFNKTIDKILNNKFLNLKQLNCYLKFLEQILNNSCDVFDKCMDIATYTCMVFVKKDKIFEIRSDIVQIIMDSMVEADVSVTAFSKYLDVLFQDGIIDVIKYCYERVDMVNILVDIIFENNVFDRDVMLASYKVQEQLLEKIDCNNIKNEFINKKNNSVFDDEITISGIYQNLFDKMTSINELIGIELFKDEFIVVEYLKKFIFLSVEDQQLFLDYVRQINLSDLGWNKKMEKVLAIIELFYFRINFNSKIITPNFTRKRK